MGKFGITELVIILAIVILLFGTKRLKNIGSDLGNAIKGFKNSVKDENAESDTEAENNDTTAQAKAVEQQSAQATSASQTSNEKTSSK